MDPAARQENEARPLPALRRNGKGEARIDFRAIFTLALPLILNSAIQAILNLTDTWFITRLGADATAGMGAAWMPVVAATILFGGAGMAVQTVVAQAEGAGLRPAAGRAVRTGLIATLLSFVPFLGLAAAGETLFGLAGLTAEITGHAVEYWQARLLGLPAGVALWTMTSFFNGIGRTRVSLILTLVVALANVPFNQLLMFELNMGIAGAAWGSTLASLLGAVLGFLLYLRPQVDRLYATRKFVLPTPHELWSLISLGTLMGIGSAVDVMAFALFQLMQVSLGPVEGAATQIVFVFTSVAFWPAIGLGLTGTTLVGQAIGAGNPDWAKRLGSAVILIAVAYMGGLGLVLALAGPDVVRFFVAADDPLGPQVILLGGSLLWWAAAYQLFDGFNLGSAFCLRGAADAKIPTVIPLVIAIFVFLPLTHILSFAPGQGWTDALPHLGFGAEGGWAAAALYVALLGTALWLRWRSGAWQRIGRVVQ
jgi:MATE family multidrug resistance protein